MQAQSNGLTAAKLQRKMEHVIIVREGSVAPHAGGCTVALVERCVRVVVDVRWSIGRMRSSWALGGGVEGALGCSWMTSVLSSSVPFLPYIIHPRPRPHCR